MMDASTDDPLAYNDNYNYSDDYGDELLRNVSLGCPPSHLPGADVFIPVVYFLIFFAGFLGNLSVIAVVVAGGQGRRAGRLVDTFILNLALADLVFVLTLPLWAVSAGRGGRWSFGPASGPLCKLSSYVIAVNRLSSITFLTCMSVDRYLAVVKLLDTRYLRSGRCIRATCAAVWLVSLVLGVPSLVHRGAELLGDELYCTESHSSPLSLGLSLATTALTFFLPLAVIVFCYATIIRHLNEHPAAAVNPRAEARRRHSVKMVLSIVAAFVASWLPLNVFKALAAGWQLSGAHLSCDARSWQKNGLTLSCCLAFLNSCVNPAIYFLLDHQFRRQAGVVCLSCMWKSTRRQNRNNYSVSITT